MSPHCLPRLTSLTTRLAAFCLAALLFGLNLGVASGRAQTPQPTRSARARSAGTRLREIRAAVQRRRDALARRIRERGRYLTFQIRERGLRNQEREVELKDERVDWFLLQRTFPSPFYNLPPLQRSVMQRLTDQRELTQKMLSPTLLDARPFWRPVGSASIEAFGARMRPTTGRVSAVAVSPSTPNVILVGAATGGIWRSEDEGSSFRPVSDKHTEVAVGSLAFSRSNPQVVYAGMGDRIAGYMGTGVLKSEDGGEEWTKISGDTLPQATVTEILVDPRTHERVYLAEYKFRDPTGCDCVREGGFRFSANGGKTWSEPVVLGLPHDIEIHPTDPDTLYLGLSNGRDLAHPRAAVFKSDDRGEHWVPILTPCQAELPDHRFAFKIAVTAASPELIYVVVTHVDPQRARTMELRVSRDGGKSWTSRAITQRDIADKTVEFLIADPRNGKTLYLGSEDLFKSTDGGETWVNLSENLHLNAEGAPEFRPHNAPTHIDQRAFAFSPTDSNVIYIGNDGGFWRSNKGGLSDGVRAFHPLNDHLPITQLLSITANHAETNTLYVGTQDNGAMISTADDPGWREFITGDSANVIVDGRNPGKAYVSFYYGNINSYVNGDFDTETKLAHNGEFFEHDNFRPRIGFFAPFTADHVTSKFYFGTWRLFRSADGDRWTAISPRKDILTKGTIPDFGSDVLTAIGLSPSDGDVIYTGSAFGKVSRTRDGGRRWVDITDGLPPRFIKSITVDLKDPQIAYVTVSGFGTGHVFKTSDGGLRWDNISGNLPNVPANALLFDPSDASIIYVGTDVGVFRSTTSGLDWQPFNEGLPPAIVSDFAVKRDNTIVISTYGRGAYELVR